MRKVLVVCLLATMTQGEPVAQAPPASTSRPTFTSAVDVVPISAILQHRPETTRKGGVLGANNLLSFTGVSLPKRPV